MLSVATLDLLSKSPGAHLRQVWSLTMLGSAGEHLVGSVADRPRGQRLEQSCYSYNLLCLIFLISPRSFFALNLFSFEACVGFVLLRGLGFTAAFRTSSTNL
jgi:hypothetical protein